MAAYIIYMTGFVYPVFAIGMVVAYYKNIHPLAGIFLLVVSIYYGKKFYEYLMSAHIENENIKYRFVTPIFVILFGSSILFYPSFNIKENLSNYFDNTRDISEGHYDQVLTQTGMDWNQGNFRNQELRVEAFKALLEECRSKSGSVALKCQYQNINYGIANEDLRPYIYEEYSFIQNEADIFSYTREFEEKSSIAEISKYEKPRVHMKDTFIEYTQLGPPYEYETIGKPKPPRYVSSGEYVWYFSDDEGNKYFFVARTTDGTVTNTEERRVPESEAEKMNVPFPNLKTNN
ncbi:hypothetical protein M3664_04390 [Paenibacillus lautus]|uniref:hypothetical protein n=1 Tax=Paenibacillus lautus TaxID=1401 RepID=UPI00203B5A30|nr:hypothetical protein [Paenibacillus lautus]MCM3257019.1 hypothetical protein [Paenibacillus lautus]